MGERARQATPGPSTTTRTSAGGEAASPTAAPARSSWPYAWPSWSRCSRPRTRLGDSADTL